jgi:ABC-2 type transport system permease protein
LRDYGIYFFSGYIFWNFFSASSTLAAESIVGNPVYVTRVYVPKILLTVASVAMSLVDLAASMVILIGLMLYFGAPFSGAMLFLPVSLMIAILFVTGLSLLFAVANVFLRDFRHLLGSFLFLWFFFSPVLWKASPANAKAALLLKVNPIVPMLAMFQMPIWKGEVPSASVILIASSMGIGVLLVGIAAFLRTERRFYYYL